MLTLNVLQTNATDDIPQVTQLGQPGPLLLPSSGLPLGEIKPSSHLLCRGRNRAWGGSQRGERVCRGEGGIPVRLRVEAVDSSRPQHTPLFPPTPLFAGLKQLFDCSCPHGGKQVSRMCNQHSLSEKGKLIFQEARAGAQGRAGKETREVLGGTRGWQVNYFPRTFCAG